MPIICISGCFDPLYQSDLDYIQKIRRVGYQLCVIILNDKQLRLLGLEPSETEDKRLRLIRCIHYVDFAVLSCDTDTVLTIKTVELIHPDIHVYSLLDTISIKEREHLIDHHTTRGIILENVMHTPPVKGEPIINKEPVDRQRRTRFSLFKLN